MASLQGKKILIIDDMPDIRLFVRQILATDGATVYEASSADAGLEMAGQQIPHLIVSDLTMPEKTGFEFLKTIKLNPLLHNIPVLVLSGLSDRESVKEAIALGAADYLLKPIKASSLLQKARKCLNSSAFLSHRFKSEDAPKASISLNAELISMSVAGMNIESSIKLVSNETLTLTGEFLNEMGCSNTVFRTSQANASLQSKGRYQGSVIFVGMGADLAKSIRQRLLRLK